MSQPTQTTIKQYQTIGDTQENWQQTVIFGQFEPSLGTLTAVDIGLAANAIGNVSEVDLGPLSATATATLSSYVAARSPGGFVLDAVAVLATNSGSIVANDGSVSLALAGTGTSDSGPLSGVDLANFGRGDAGGCRYHPPPRNRPGKHAGFNRCLQRSGRLAAIWLRPPVERR
jgi:hypothetical protein